MDISQLLVVTLSKLTNELIERFEFELHSCVDEHVYGLKHYLLLARFVSEVPHEPHGFLVRYAHRLSRVDRIEGRTLAAPGGQRDAGGKSGRRRRCPDGLHLLRKFDQVRQLIVGLPVGLELLQSVFLLEIRLLASNLQLLLPLKHAFRGVYHRARDFRASTFCRGYNHWRWLLRQPGVWRQPRMISLTEAPLVYIG